MPTLPDQRCATRRRVVGAAHAAGAGGDIDRQAVRHGPAQRQQLGTREVDTEGRAASAAFGAGVGGVGHGGDRTRRVTRRRRPLATVRRMPEAGYSGTPLPKKLGIAAGLRVVALNPPRDYRNLVSPWPEGATLATRADAKTDLVHLFVAERAVLGKESKRLRALLQPNAVLWVSWPKKASKVATDVTEDVIREVVLPLGWVDVKVCAVDATWSGLKLVVRKALR